MTYSHALNLIPTCWCGREAQIYEDDRIICAKHWLEIEQARTERSEGTDHE